MARRKRRHTKQNVANASENMLFITSFGGFFFFFCDLFIFELRQHTMPTSDLLKNNNNRKFFFFLFFFREGGGVGREGQCYIKRNDGISLVTIFLCRADFFLGLVALLLPAAHTFLF